MAIVSTPWMAEFVAVAYFSRQSGEIAGAFNIFKNPEDSEDSGHRFVALSCSDEKDQFPSFILERSRRGCWR